MIIIKQQAQASKLGSWPTLHLASTMTATQRPWEASQHRGKRVIGARSWYIILQLLLLHFYHNYHNILLHYMCFSFLFSTIIKIAA